MQMSLLKNIKPQLVYIYRHYIKGTKNWPKSILFRLGFFKEINCEFKNLGKVKLTRDDVNNGFFLGLISISSKKLSNEQKKTIHDIISQKN